MSVDIIRQLRLRGDGISNEAADEIDRLRTIVDHLPHTADGAPIYPGMLVWLVSDDEDLVGIWSVKIEEILPPNEGESCCLLLGRTSDGDTFEFSPDECYSERPQGQEG